MKNGFSIILCCHNSEKKIELTLTYISRLKKPNNIDFEVILVDNNSTDNTVEIATNHWRELHLSIPFKVVAEPLLGLSNARKKGILESVGEIIVFCDDDNRLDKDYLQLANQIMKTDANIGFIGGRGIVKTEAELPPWFNLLENCYAVGEQYEKDGDITNTKGYVWGAGMVIRRSVFQKLLNSGFQSLLLGRKGSSMMAGEDTELCILGKQLGYSIYYDSRLRYYHYIPQSRISWKSLIRLWEGFSKSHVYLGMYEAYFNYISTRDPAKISWFAMFKKNARAFFFGCSTINWYKTLYITFIENRIGYLPGLEKRKYFHRMKELLRIRFTYKTYIKKIANFRIGN